MVENILASLAGPDPPTAMVSYPQYVLSNKELDNTDADTSAEVQQRMLSGGPSSGTRHQSAVCEQRRKSMTLKRHDNLSIPKILFKNRICQVKICIRNSGGPAVLSQTPVTAQMEELSPSMEPVHDQQPHSDPEGKQIPRKISQQTIDEIKHRFFESQGFDEAIKRQSPALLSLELHVDVLFARTQVSIQLRRFEKASHSLDEAIQIARAIDDRQLTARCDFWVGMMCSEEGDRPAAAENFLKAIEIVGTDCPEAAEEAKMLSRYMAYLRLFLEREVSSEIEAQNTMKLLEAVVAEFVSEEDRKVLTPLSVGKSSISWPSSASWLRDIRSGRQSFVRVSSAQNDSSVPGRRSAVSLGSYAASVNRSGSTWIPRPISMGSNSTARSFIPIDRFLEDLQNPNHNVDTVNRMLRNQRRPGDRTRNVRQSLIERLKLNNSGDWSSQSPQSARREVSNSSEEETKSPTPKEAQLSDTLAPGELDKRVEATIGRRKSIGLNTAELEVPLTVPDSDAANFHIHARRQSTDPPVSSPLRRASLPGNEEDVESSEE